MKSSAKPTLLIKIGSYISDLEKTLLDTRRKKSPSVEPFKNKNFSEVDLNTAYKIIAQVESGGKPHAIGDVGTSFGLTQVHAPYLLQMFSIDPEAQRHLGISAQDLKQMSTEWIQTKKKLKQHNIWKKEVVNPSEVKSFIRQNPNSVVKRMEGATIRYSPQAIIKKRGDKYIKKTINWDALKELGFNVYSTTTRADIEYAISNYITENVFRSSLAQAYVKNSNPRAFNRFKGALSSKNIKKDERTKEILNRASQRDFMKKVGSVLSALRKSNYDTSVPGALNPYQLIAISNASGPRVVREFLLNGKKLSPGNLHYLIRANKYIQKETGISCSIPSDPLVGFKVASFDEIVKRASQGELFFPSGYADSIKDGSRSMTIRAHDVPFEANDIIKAKTYANVEICDLRILEKNIMSLVRIRKAFGHYIADELERKFGPEGRFVVLRFEPSTENMAKDECSQKLDDWSSSHSNSEYGIKNIQDPEYHDESGAITSMPPKQMVPIDGVGSYVASKKFDKIARRQNVEQEYIWMWDAKKHLLHVEKNVQDEKEISGVQHSKLITDKNIQFINDEKNPRGFVTFYKDGSKEISTYGTIFNQISWKVQMKVFEMFDLPMDGSVKFIVLPAPRSFVSAQSLILVPRYGFNEEEFLISKKNILNHKVVSISNQAISENGIVINATPISDIDISQHKCIVVIGGQGSREFSHNKLAQAFIKKFKYSLFVGKSLFLAAKANVLSNLMVTGDEDAFGSIKRSNAKWTGMPIEVDGSFVSVDGIENIKNAILVLSSIYDDEGMEDVFELMEKKERVKRSPYGYEEEDEEEIDEMEGFLEVGLEEEEEEDEAAKWLKQMEMPEKEIVEKPKKEKETVEEQKKEVVEEPAVKPKKETFDEPTDPVAEPSSLYKDLASLLEGDDDDEKEDLDEEERLSKILKKPTKEKHYKSFEEILTDVQKPSEIEETKEEDIKEDVETKEQVLEKPEEETEEITEPEEKTPIQEFLKVLEEKPEEEPEETFEEEFDELEENDEEIELLSDLTNEELQQLLLSSEQIEELEESNELLKDLTDEELADLLASSEEDGSELLGDTSDEDLQLVTSKEFLEESQEKIETSVGKVNKEEFEEVFGPTDEKSQNSEDKFEKKELTKRERAKTIFGPKLEPITDEDDNILSSWPDLTEIKAPEMSEEAASLFSIENISNDRKLSEIFNDPDQKAWHMLHEEPHLLQSWLLPGLVVAVGKKWFDNQKSRASTGSTFRRLGNTPFGLFDLNDAEELKENPELEIEDLPKARKYMQEVNSILPQLINLYFSNGYSGKPIGGWLKTALEREMKKVVAEVNDFKEKRVPRCTICKTNSPKNPNVGRMEEIFVDKKTLWYCPDCVRKAEDLERNEIKQVSKELKKANSELEMANQRIQTYRFQLDDDEFPKGESKETIIEKLETQEREKDNIESTIKSLGNKKEQYVAEKEKYEAQQNVPRWHTTCPNMDCPGQKVPLTSIAWDNPYWEMEENKNIAQQLYDRFKIQAPSWERGESQEAKDEDKKDPRFIPPEWMLTVPFICPHDGKKFTLLSAQKEADSNGDWRDGVGFLTDPYFKLSWVPKGDLSNKKTQSMESSGELGKNHDMYEELAYDELGDVARNIFLKKYWEKYNVVRDLKKEYGEKWDKALKRKGVMSVIREMSLYDSARVFSVEDQISYVAWLASRELSYMFSKEGKAVSKWATIKNTRISNDQISLPMLQKWVNDMLYSMGSNWQDGFEAFRLKDWLVNEKVEDIPSDGPGTFCFMQINELVDLKEEDKKDVPLGFKMELVPAKLRGGLRSSANFARLLKVVGLWKVSPMQVSEIKNKIYKLKDYKNKIGLRETIPKMFVKDIISNENIVSQILDHDFNNVKLNLENTDLVSGDWVLVQSLMMPGQYKWPPLKAISQMREDTDDERIFKNFAKVTINKEDDFEFWKKFRKQIEKIKHEVADNEDLMKMQIKQLIESGIPESFVDDSLREDDEEEDES